MTELQVAGRALVPAVGVGAVVLNVTVTGTTGAGFVTVWPCGAAMPLASNLNYVGGETVPNAVITQLGSGGSVCLYTNNATDLVVDINGWLPLAPNQPDSNVTEYPEGAALLVSGGPSTGAATIDVVGTPAPVGGIVVITTADGPYYGQVTAVAGNRLITEEVALADVIPIMDLSLIADTSSGVVSVSTGAAAISGFSVLSAGPSLQAVGTASGHRTENLVKNTNAKCGVGTQASVDLAFDVNPGNFVFDVSLNRWKTGLGYARIGFNPYLTATAGTTAAGMVTCDLNAFIGSANLPTIKFSVYGVPVWITQQLDASITGHIEAQAAGTRTFTATASAWVGMEYTNGSWNRQASMTFDVTQDSAADITMSLSLAIPKITYHARLYGIAGLDADLAPTLALTYNPADTTYLKLTSQVDITIGASLKLDLKIVSFDYSHTFATATLFGPRLIWSKSSPGATTTTADPGTTTTAATTTTSSPTTSIPPPDPVVTPTGPTSGPPSFGFRVEAPQCAVQVGESPRFIMSFDGSNVSYVSDPTIATGPFSTYFYTPSTASPGAHLAGFSCYALTSSSSRLVATYPNVSVTITLPIAGQTSVTADPVTPGGSLRVITGAPGGSQPCPTVPGVNWYNDQIVIDGLVGPTGPYTLVYDAGITNQPPLDTFFEQLIPAEQPIGSHLTVKASCGGWSTSAFLITADYIIVFSSVSVTVS